MRQSQLFTETQREAPKDEKSKNSQLLIRAGFIDKLMAGVYSYLPLGFLVLKKIENIIREEIQKIGGQELFLPALHPKENWLKTSRWQQKEMFKLKSRSGKDCSLGWTHEEIITPLVKKFVKSYKNLPVAVYQIQTKFRDELRAKSGLLRGVEFIMKDLYSFHQDEEDLDKYYEKVKKAYFQIFKRCGLAKQTFLTLASGGTFSKYSHEFQVITPYGEDTIYLCPKCKLAINKEIIKEEKYKCSKCQTKKLEIKRAIEVGNIFKLKDKFSRPFDFTFVNREGKKKLILMGCYGIGLPRLMGAIVEVCHDEKGIIWPREVAPFQVHLIPLAETSSHFAPYPVWPGSVIENTQKVKKISQKLYQDLQEARIEVLYDDREDKTAGEKFADADLIGIPLRIVVSERTLRKNCLELKQREKKEIKLVRINQVKKYVK
ncbi:MAG: His/Gly/Thr/Pro-type tRNA ligase C-terminal domain-containing protein [Patescibacteria group bacterium]|nr:His/Gly/Thr/Pro-type tRNA ligase C-terminal domain-containing protein [Patescibacteria group bacterium]